MKTKFTLVLLLSLTFSAYAQTPLSEYLFTAGSLQNSGSGTDALTQFGSALTGDNDRDGFSGNAISLNGDVLQEQSGARRTNYSVSFWMNTSTNDVNNRYLVDQWGGNPAGKGDIGYRIYLLDGEIKAVGKFFVANSGLYLISGTASTGGGFVADGQWHHIVLTIEPWSRSTLNGLVPNVRYKLYVDNVLKQNVTTEIGTIGGTTRTIQENVPLSIGNIQDQNATYYYEDQIDDIQLYTSTLSVGEIATINSTRTSATRIYVNSSAVGNNDGTSWADAYTNLKTATDNATAEGDEIWVAAGTYTPDASDRTKSFILQNEVKLYGGFNGTETQLTERDWVANQTVLSGDLSGNDGSSDATYTEALRSENTYRILVIKGSNTLVDGITITGGNANHASNSYYYRGAAIYKVDAANTVTLKNSIFTKNVSNREGIIKASFYGGTSSFTVENCTFSNNFSRWGTGFSVIVESGAATEVKLFNSLFYNNIAGDISGATGFAGSSMYIAVQSGSANFEAINNTFANNQDLGTSSPNDKGTIALRRLNNNSSAIINAKFHNNIFFENLSGAGVINAQIIGFMNRPDYKLNTLTFTHNVSNQTDFSGKQANPTVSNNIDQDPLFTNAAGGDYTLTASSPAINAGDNSKVVILSDLVQNIRKYDGTVDMGAYEYGSGPINFVAPTAVAQNISVQLDGSGQANITPSQINNGSTDDDTADNNLSLSLDISTFTCDNIGANIVTLTVADASGNESTATATVTVSFGVNDETVVATSSVCADGSSTTITTGSSVSGLEYYLRNSGDNSLVDGPITGTGASLNFNTGAINQATTYNVFAQVATAANKALNFDGTNDYMSAGIPANLDYSAAYTMEAWVKAPLPGSAGYYPIFFIGNSTISDIEVYIQKNSNKLNIVYNRGNTGFGGYSYAIPPADQWFHLAVTFDGTTTRVFYDGVEQPTLSDSGPGPILKSSGAEFNVGYIKSSAFNYTKNLNGEVDDVRIWNVVKSEADILAAKNSCLSGSETGLSAYYDFNDGTGLSATDLVGANNGVLNNMVGSTDWVDGATIICESGCSFQMTTEVTLGVDAVNPTAIAQDITVQLDGDGLASITTADINNGSTDNCTDVSGLVFSLDKVAFTCIDTGANTVTLTVEDATGNTSTATATVTIEDGVAPTPIAQDITVQLDGTGNAVITASEINNASNDNCTSLNSLILSLDKTAFTCSDLGANTVTLTVEDFSSNQGMATATVTVVDGVVPTAIAQDITVQLDATGSVTVAASEVDNSSLDNCSSGANLVLSLDKSTFGCADLGANTVTLTVIDASANFSTTTATVTVEDNLAPTATARNITVNLDATGNVSITAAQVNNGSTDNCTATGDLVLSLDKTDFVIADVGANTVTLTVADANGNSSTATATVTVEEKTNQSITFAALDNKTYGDASFTLSSTATSSLAVSFTVVSGPATIAGSEVSITGAGEVVLEASQSGDATFAVAPVVQQSFTVNQAALTVTADDQSITYGDVIPTLTSTYAGFVNSEDATALTTEPTAATTATAVSDAGSYAITLAGGEADNYSIMLTSGSLTINQADQTVTLDAIADQDITQVTTVEVTSTVSSGLAATLTVTGPATISGTTITLDGTVGTVTVTANQAGNVNYTAASDVTSFEVFDSTDPCLGFAVTLNSITDNMCNGASEGVIDIAVTGGDGNYSYAWSNGTADQVATNLAAGSYTVTVTDGNNCSVTLTETINEPTLIEITATTTDVVAGNDGAADITVTGGTGAYSYSWSNGAEKEDLSNIAAGTYTVTVTDDNNCSVTQTVEVGDVITGVEDITTTMQIYPNPVSDYLTLEGAFNNESVEVQIINTEGKQMLTKRFEKLTSNIIEVELGNLKNGQYLVIININNKQTVERINIKH